MTTLKEAGELEAIRRFQRHFPQHRGIVTGSGDDCAVVRLSSEAERDLLLTSDPVIEGTHFDPTASPKGIGHKAAGRVLSDIAAMGGRPEWLLANMVAPATATLESLEAVCIGFVGVCNLFGATLAGGDLARGNSLEVHAFGVGSLPAGAAILRSGAAPGESLFVTGSLGASRAGKQFTFLPRVKEGEWLRKGDWATSMIDISDGLVSDAYHIAAASGVDVMLDLSAIPISEAAKEAYGERDHLAHALTDGEDFELLFTVPERRRADFELAWALEFKQNCTCIGSIAEGDGKVRGLSPEGTGSILSPNGYEHFRS